MSKGDSAADEDTSPRIKNEVPQRQQQQQQGNGQGYYSMYGGGGIMIGQPPVQPSLVHPLPPQQQQQQGSNGGSSMVDPNNSSSSSGGNNNNGNSNMSRDVCSPTHQPQVLLQQQQQQQHHTPMGYQQHQQLQVHQQHAPLRSIGGGDGSGGGGSGGPVRVYPSSDAPASATSPDLSPTGSSEQRRFSSKLPTAKPLGGGGEVSDDSPPLEALQEHYHMSLEQAARALGISLNKLKRACRQYGIPRWPYRQVRSIRSTIQSLEKALEKCESEMETSSLKDRLDSLVKKESLVCKFASCGLTGPLRNMLFSSKPESICDVLIKDIVEQSGRSVGVGSGGTGGRQDHTPTAGMKRGRGDVGAMSHGGMPQGFGAEKQHAWVPTNVYRMPVQHAGQMAPPLGMEKMGMQYFMPTEATAGMGYMDGSQHHHRRQQQQQHQQQQQQLMLMQSNPGFAMQSGFVPVGYDLYGQAPQQFVGAGMEGLAPGAPPPPPPHGLVSYMQPPHLAGSPGDAMRVSQYAQWHGGMPTGVGGDAAGLGGMGAMLQQQQQQTQQQHQQQQQQQQQQFMQQRHLHHQQPFGYAPAPPPGVYTQDQRSAQGDAVASSPQMGQLHQAWQQSRGGNPHPDWGPAYSPRGAQPLLGQMQGRQQRDQLSSPMAGSGSGGVGAVGVSSLTHGAPPEAGSSGSPPDGMHMSQYPNVVPTNRPGLPGWGYVAGSSPPPPQPAQQQQQQQRQQQQQDEGRVPSSPGTPGWTGRSPSSSSLKGVEGTPLQQVSAAGAAAGGGGSGNPSRESDGGARQQQQQQQQAGWSSASPTGPITPCSAEEAELLVAAADTGRRTAAARGSVSPLGSKADLESAATATAGASASAASDGSPSTKVCLSNGVDGGGGGRSPVAHKGGGTAKTAAAVATPAARAAVEAEAVAVTTSEAAGRGRNGSSTSERSSSSRSNDGLESTTRSPPARLPGVGGTTGGLGGVVWGTGGDGGGGGGPTSGVGGSGKEDGSASATAFASASTPVSSSVSTVAVSAAAAAATDDDDGDSAAVNGVKANNNNGMEQKQPRRVSPRGSGEEGGGGVKGEGAAEGGEEEESDATKMSGSEEGDGGRATKQSSSSPRVVGGGGGVRPPSSSVSSEAEGQAGETVTTSCKHQACKVSENGTSYCRAVTANGGTPPGKSVHVYE